MSCSNAIGPEIKLGYSVNPILWGFLPTFFAGPNQLRYYNPSWDYRLANVTKTIELYVNVLFGFFEENPPFGTTDTPISFRYESQKPGNVTIISVDDDNQLSLQVLSFNVEDPRGSSTTFSDLNNIFGLPADPPLSDILCWIFATWNSVTLFDIGQVADPTAVVQTNIFLNQTIYDNYNSFLRDVVVPFFNGSSNYDPNFFNPLPLNGTNRLQATPIPLQTTYLCSQRQLKGWATVFISVIAADSALIMTAYSFFIFIAGYFQKRRDKSGQMKFIVIND
jgi:hypothetical protein